LSLSLPHSTSSEKSSAENLKNIEIRGNVSLKQAGEEILAYLKEHKEAETFDIANDFCAREEQNDDYLRLFVTK
jgi:hypothetical protein